MAKPSSLFAEPAQSTETEEPMISVPTHGKVFSKKAKNPHEPKTTKLLTEPEEPVPQTRRL